MGGFGLAARLQAFALCLAVILIGVRGLVPAGYMIDTSAGAPVLRLCGGFAEHGQHRAASPSNESHAHHQHTGDSMPSGPDMPGDHDIGAMCPFALSAVFDLPVLLDEAVLSLFGPPLLGGEPFFAPVRAYAVRPALPPRGPPLSV